MRIRSIDYIKGVTILSVINMHVCAWSGTLYLADYYRGLSALWNVPVFFFIAGFFCADNSDANASFIYVAKQSLKLLRDFLIVIIFLIIVTTLILAIDNSQVIFTYKYFDNTLAALLFRPGGILLDPWRVLIGSYWFIVIYFKLLFTLPAYYLIRDNLIKRPLLILALTYWFFILLVDKTFLFYMLFFWLGFAYKVNPGIIPTPMAIILSLLISSAYGIYVLITKTFPILSVTSVPYIIIELVPILILTILIHKERGVKLTYSGYLSKLLQWAGRNSFKIYLWEAVFTSLPYFYVSFLQNSLSPFTLYSFNLVMSCTLTLIAVRLHEIILSRFNDSKLRTWFIRSWLSKSMQ